MSRTKDRYKSEEKETERLVRKAPKSRSPRTDRRRETVKDSDPDLDGGDKDLSLNYKDIGGSLSGIGHELKKSVSKYPYISNQLHNLSSNFFDVSAYESSIVTRGMFSGLPRYEARRIAGQYLSRLNRVSQYLDDPEIDDLIFKIHSNLELVF